MTEHNTYRLLSYQSSEGPRAGLLVDDAVLDLTEALAAYTSTAGPVGFSGDTVLGVLEAWDKAETVLRAVAKAQRDGAFKVAIMPLEDVKLLAPILYPPSIICATANYSDHIMEMRKVPPPDKAVTRPCFFLKASRHTVIGPGDVARISPTSDKVFWEGELGVVIGRKCHLVKAADALDYVAGYLPVNDLSDSTDTVRRKGDTYGQWFGHDWFRNKFFNDAAPMGPWITPAEDVEDPQDLPLKTTISGRVMQDSSTRNMHFTVAEQIEYLSERLTLYPGDVLMTGTCKGIGRDENKWLQSGDTVEVEIGHLGRLHHSVVKETQPA